MSNSEAQARLTVPTTSSTLEIEVLNSNFELVGSGVGGLDASLAPGLYEIRFREGSEHESRLLKVGAGPRVVEAPSFQPASPAPVSDTSTTHEYHQQPVIDANDAIANQCAGGGPESGGLVVMVRNVRGQDNLEFQDPSGRLSILNSRLEPLGSPGNWQVEEQSGWALYGRAVVPGGYALRSEGGAEPIHQALWVDDGWQTLVFIPNTKTGPALDLATVHIARVGQWSPWDDGSRTAIALESVLDGLRSGRSVIPEDLNELFHAKFVNPFLGIAAATAMLLNPKPSLPLLKTVLDNLEQLLPKNPDVVGLGHRALAAGAEIQPREGVEWPPLLYANYRALLRADANRPGVIADGSQAESAAARVRVSGLWTTWAASRRGRARASIDIDVIGNAEEESDPATARVRAYVEDAARVRKQRPVEILDRKSLKQIALATGLPSAAVRASISKLKVDFE